MATLVVQKGPDQGKKVTLSLDTTILGRNPDCGVVIPVTSVSRQHAQILQMQGKFYLEDLKSRNGTFLNDKRIEGKTLLKSSDQIRICDYQLEFSDEKPSFAELYPDENDKADEHDTSSATIEAKLVRSGIAFELQPAEKLATLLDITANLSKILQLQSLLPKIAESLFQLFRQADRCFLILREEGTDKLMPKLVKTRRAQDEENARFSKTIIRTCLASGEAILLDDAGNQLMTSQSVVDFRIRSVMCAPLCNIEGQPFGVIQLDTQDRSKKFTQEDLKLLVGVANQAAVALENAHMHESMVAQERVNRDLELAKQVQLSFLPQALPEVPGYEFYAHYEAAQAVGGDYYGFVPLPTGLLAVTVGDVAGKGVPAALLMAKLSADCRFCVHSEPTAAGAINKLNRLLYEHTSQMDRFVTLAALLLDPAKHTVTIVNAGHPSPMLYTHATGKLTECVPRKVTGVPLGMLDEFTYDSIEIPLQKGDFLVTFSDGVPDSMSVANHPFGNDGVYALLEGATTPFTPKSLGDKLVQAIHRHAAGRSAHDDLTLVCVGRAV